MPGPGLWRRGARGARRTAFSFFGCGSFFSFGAFSFFSAAAAGAGAGAGAGAAACQRAGGEASGEEGRRLESAQG